MQTSCKLPLSKKKTDCNIHLPQGHYEQEMFQLLLEFFVISSYMYLQLSLDIIGSFQKPSNPEIQMSCLAIYDHNNWKTIPFGVAHTCTNTADRREYVPPPQPGSEIHVCYITLIDGFQNWFIPDKIDLC